MNGISGICGDQANGVSIVEKGNVQGPLKTQSLLIVVLAKLYIIQKWIQEEWTTKEKYHVPNNSYLIFPVNFIYMFNWY